MFNMGFTELIVLGVVALIFIGPKQLPEVARVIARLINELKRATGDLSGSLNDVRHEADKFVRETEQSVTKHLLEPEQPSPLDESADDHKDDSDDPTS